jgi:hypothetical protein
LRTPHAGLARRCGSIGGASQDHQRDYACESSEAKVHRIPYTVCLTAQSKSPAEMSITSPWGVVSITLHGLVPGTRYVANDRRFPLRTLLGGLGRFYGRSASENHQRDYACEASARTTHWRSYTAFALRRKAKNPAEANLRWQLFWVTPRSTFVTLRPWNAFGLTLPDQTHRRAKMRFSHQFSLGGV